MGGNNTILSGRWIATTMILSALVMVPANANADHNDECEAVAQAVYLCETVPMPTGDNVEVITWVESPLHCTQVPTGPGEPAGLHCRDPGLILKYKTMKMHWEAFSPGHEDGTTFDFSDGGAIHIYGDAECEDPETQNCEAGAGHALGL